MLYFLEFINFDFFDLVYDELTEISIMFDIIEINTAMDLIKEDVIKELSESVKDICPDKLIENAQDELSNSL